MNLSAVFHQAVSPWIFSSPDGSIEIKLKTDKDIQAVELIYGDPHEGEVFLKSWRWKARHQAMKMSGDGNHHRYWTLRITAPNNRLKYQFKLSDGHGSIFFGEERFSENPDPREIWNYFFFPYVHPNERYQAPSWVQSTVWYQIFPERFNAYPPVKSWKPGPVKNSIHYGGNLRGIIEKLPYLAELGITGIYMTPVFESPTAHKYDTTDYFKIDSHFGSEADLKELVHKAHALNIRIMLDAVFNHSGVTFEPWIKAQEKDSPYREWFHFKSLGYETFAFAKNMPKLNTEHPDVIDYFCKVGTYWIKQCDIDGWRLDVANEVAPSFWRAFRKAVKTAKPDVYILGEIWHDSNAWLSGDMMDAVMNYPFTSLVNKYLIQGTLDKEAFMASMTDTFNRYPLAVLVNQFNLFDSHDTARLMTQAKGDVAKVKQALAFLFFAFGSPCIYYGTEIGMEGENDPDCRRLMQFDPDPRSHPLFCFIQSLIQLRRKFKPFEDLSEWSWIDDAKCLIARRSNHILILNPTNETLPIPDGIKGSPLFPDHETHDLEPYAIRVYQES